MALALLRDDRLDALITEEIAFETLPARAAAAARARALRASPPSIRYP